jgi:RHS repeat-associated protein
MVRIRRKDNSNCTIIDLLLCLLVFTGVGCGGGGGDGGANTTDMPPQISHVASSVFSDTDNSYPTGRMVRLDIDESSGEADIVSGTVCITSATTGYDSGVQDVMFGSIFYHWDTSGLDPADDYIVRVTLVDAGGQETIDESLVVTLVANPPAINELVSRIDLSVHGAGIPVRILRTYLLDSGFDNSLGYGWTHSYLMHVVQSTDGLVKVFNADGSGSFYTSNGDGTYESPKGDFRVLTQHTDGTYQLREKTGKRYHFNISGKLTGIEDSNGNSITLNYSTDGLLETITDGLSRETTLAYDINNRLQEVTGPAGRTVSYAYDSAGDLISVTDIGGFTTQYAYDADHNLTTITDPAGRQTFFTTDSEDRLESISNAGGVNRRTFAYGVPAVNQMTVTDALGHQTIFTYNNYALITAITDPAGNTAENGYDENLNLIRRTDAAGNQTIFTYDSRGNLLTATDAQANTTTVTYEAQFNKIDTVTDANGNTTDFDYDANGNLTTKTYPNGNTESFSYTNDGNMSRLTDTNGNITTFEYDTRARLTAMNYPDGSAEMFTYDVFGNINSKTDRMGRTKTYEYDSAGRLIKTSYPDNTSVGFEYDPSGKLLGATDANGSFAFEYNGTGRMARAVSPGGEVVSYSYDAAGNRTRLIYPNGMVLDYTYDVHGRLSRINQSGHMVASYDYDSLSRITRRELQNGIYSTYSYDTANRLLELLNRKSTAEIISSFAYTYDNVGNRLTMTTLDGLTQYTYDDANQLTDVIYPDASTTSYNLDSAGNRVSEVVDGDAIAYTTNELNQYTDVNGDAYAYDANGNMTSKTTSEGATVYTYDFENRLVQVDTVTETISYTYDPFGRRTSKTTSSGTTNYFHDGFQVIMEEGNAGMAEATYVYGIGIDEVLLVTRDGGNYFYCHDGLGSVTDITNTAADVVDSFSYDAFGVPNNDSITENLRLFAGRSFEPKSGLYFYRARYYDPGIGRFITPDPIGYGEGANLYLFVQNNPVNWVDPSGLASNCPHCRSLWCAQLRMRCVFLCYLDPLSLPGGACWACKKKVKELCGDDKGGGGNIKRGDPTFIQRSPNQQEEKKISRSAIKEEKLYAKFSMPYENCLIRANVPISGYAYGKNFKEYRVEYGVGKNPSEWIHIYTSTQPQTKAISLQDLDDSLDLTIHGNLGTWDTGLKNYVYLPSHPKDHPIDLKGTYTIRLLVTGDDGAMAEDRVTVDVANVIPNAWGGRATSEDGRVVLTVPEQAIMDSFRLILIDPAQKQPIDSPSKRQIIGNAYRVREPGEQFTKEALMQIAYQKEETDHVSLEKLGIYGYDSKSKTWEYLDSTRDAQNNLVFAKVRKLHDCYALMTSDVTGEGSVEAPGLGKTALIQQASANSGYSHILVKNTFEDGLGEWSNRDYEVGATVTLDDSVTYDGTKALKVSNTHVGGNFALNVVTTPFNAKAYPLVQFDYRIPENLKTNFLVKVDGRWYDIGFTDDPKKFKDMRVNIAHIGDIENIEADDQWHTARFNLYDMLRTKTGNTQVEAMIMADWDVDGYMKLSFGKNPKKATYYIDNFIITREPLVGLQTANDMISVDNFNQMKRTNALGGRHAIFTDRQSGVVDLDFHKKTSSGKGRALALKFDVSCRGSYAGYSCGLQDLDLRGFQRLTFLVKSNADGGDCMVGIRDRSGNESKVQLSRHLPGGTNRKWQVVEIPLVAFSQIKDWGHIRNVNLGFEHSLCPKGIVYLDDLSFERSLKALKIDDFENSDQKNTIGMGHNTYVSGNAAVNGKHTKGSPNGIYRISYGGNIGKIKAYASDLKSFAGWRTALGGVDGSHCQNLTMGIRGAEGEENFTVYLSDGNFRWGVDVSKYAQITADWQTVTIPLAAFAAYGVDLTHLDELQVVFEGSSMSGTVYLDDLFLGPGRERAL